MMRALAKVGFNQSYTYFTWRNTKRGARPSTSTELARARCATTSGRTSSPNTPGHPPRVPRRRAAGRRSRRGSCSRRRSRRRYGIYSGFEHCENVPVRAGQRGVPRLGEVRGQEARARRPAAAARRDAERDPARAPGRSSGSTTSTFLETAQRQPDRLREARRRATRVIVVRQPRPDRAARGRSSIVPAELGLPPAFAVQRPARPARRYAWRTGGNYVRLAARRRPRDAASDEPRPTSSISAERLGGRSAGSSASARPRPTPRRSGSSPTRSGSSAPSSTRSTSAASPTATTTASATSAASPRSSTTSSGSASTASGCCRCTRRRCATAATTSPTSTRSTPTTARVEDFRTFVEAAHERGIRVIADLVMNHTSSDHPWFQESRSGPRRRRSATGTSGRTPTTATRTRGSSSSTPSRRTGRGTRSPAQYYWHRFFSHQPDLNYDNPEVQDAMLDVLRFWLDLGLDGFRLDAVPYLFERDGHELREPARDARVPQARPRRGRRAATPTACCSPRRTSGRPTSSTTSATATSATWRSTSR